MAYTEEQIQEKFDLIIDRLENGESVRNILPDIHMSSRTFYNWIEASESREKQYARALEIRAEIKFESIEADYLEKPRLDPVTGKIDTGWVQLQRLKIDSKKWELSKLMPKKYGDKMELDNRLSGSVNVINLGSGKNPNEAT